ncbi:VanZ family protein [Dehalobacter sp. DCM]|uniref:VanZ family protein n=1 Tax=Dehalobacter sp. DCM TaxID=2907827 RepID=UPI003081CE81|nr:VanZ family protein [Dehalobacter sp. DCM]
MYFLYLAGDVMGYLIPGIAASLCYIAVSEAGRRIRNERANHFHKTISLIFGLYLTVIFAITISPVYGFTSPADHLGRNINVNPLQMITALSENPFEFLGNILLFIPLGGLLVLLFNQCQKLHITLFVGAGLSLMIELLQLFGYRSSDIDDVILNTIGTICGYFLAILFLSRQPSFYQKVGVMRRLDGRYYRKHRDASGLLVLILFDFAAVFITGFSKINALQVPTNLSLNLPSVSATIAEVNGIFPANHSIEASNPIAQDLGIQVSSQISAKSVYLWDVSSNKVLYTKEGQSKIAPASTVKMLTALTVLAYCDLNEEVRVGKEIERIAEDASRSWLYPGYRLTVRQLLNALLVPSGNDAAYALAVYTGRKICQDDTVGINKALSVFMKAMNQKAMETGANHSNFTAPDGYDAQGQYTTAQDLAFIAKAFYQSHVLREIAASPSISDVWLSGQNADFNNTNALIDPSSIYYYRHAVGLKSGTSKEAGCCLASAAMINNNLYICIIMGSTEEGRWTDSLALYHAIEDIV